MQQTMTAKLPLLERLDSRLIETLHRVEHCEFFAMLEDPDSDPRRSLAFMREIMVDIWSYQKPITEALFTAVGRIGTQISQQPLIRAMIAVQIEEIGHGHLALLDYVALGGDEHFAIARRPSPAAQAFIAVVRQLCEREDPLTHLGVMYFLEKFTVLVTRRVTGLLQSKRYPDDRLQFMRLHAEEDVRHSDMLANAINEALSIYADAEESIEYGFDCFAQVYPEPVWQRAFERSESEFLQPVAEDAAQARKRAAISTQILK